MNNDLTGRACPVCSTLMARRLGVGRRQSVLLGTIHAVPDIVEICPRCQYEIKLHFHPKSNAVGRAFHLQMEGMYGEAKGILLGLLAENPTLDAAFCLAGVCSQMGEIAEAENWFKRGMELLDQWPASDVSTRQDFLVDYGFFLLFQAEPPEFEKAEEILNRAIGEFEANYKAHLNLASAYAMTEQWERAAACYERVLQLNPGHPCRESLQAVKDILGSHRSR